MIATESAKGTEPFVELMLVTPERALNWLENANNRNRRVSDAYVQRLARDMRNGRWVLTHEGIAFDPNGMLLDGQHRLWAVVMAETAVQMHIWFNVTAESLMVINSGRARTLTDNLKLGGGLGNVSGRELATLRGMLGRGVESPSLTPSEAKELLAKHRQAVGYACEHLAKSARSKGVSTGETRGVVARAWYSGDGERLGAFCEVLRTSVAKGPEDEVAILLRTYLMSTPGNSRQLRRERYGKTERALLAFLEGDELSRLYATDKELFPLPEENGS